MKITHSALALLVGSSLAIAATKEFSVVEDNSMRNKIASGYADESCFSAESEMLTVVHFSC